MTEQEKIVEVVNKLFIYTDDQQWDKLLSEVFENEVHLDMSSLGGGDPILMKATTICDAWKTGFAGIDSIHHQAGNYLVRFINNDQVEVFCYAIAIHFKKAATEGVTREFVGSYNIGLLMTSKGWRINSFKYNLKFVKGNTMLK